LSLDSIDSTYTEGFTSSKQLELTNIDNRALNDMRCYWNTADYVMTDFQALLCLARIQGFALKEKV
jgi:hypothetical protein